MRFGAALIAAVVCGFSLAFATAQLTGASSLITGTPGGPVAGSAMDFDPIALFAALMMAISFGITTAAIFFARGQQRLRGEAEAARDEAQQAQLRVHRSFQSLQECLASERLAIVRWTSHGPPQVLFNTLSGDVRAPDHLLDPALWLSEHDAGRLQRALSGLRERATGFVLTASTRDERWVSLTGRSAGGEPILTVRELEGDALRAVTRAAAHAEALSELENYRRLFDDLPLLIWFSDAEGRTIWANTAYTTTVAEPGEDGARGEGATAADAAAARASTDARDAREAGRSAVLSRTAPLLDATDRARLVAQLGRPIAAQSADETGPASTPSGSPATAGATARLGVTLAGERRTLDVSAVRMGSLVAFFASDVTQLEQSRVNLTRLATAYNRTLDKVSTAIATFGADARLVFHNDAFNALSGLSAPWLASRPREGEALDRLRERGLLPVTQDYRRWKTELMDTIRAQDSMEDWWHLPDGRTLHVIAEKQPDAGVTYLFDDVSEKLELESRFNELLKVQGQTLDQLNEGVAVFATDGRLKLFNSALGGVWALDDVPLVTENGIHVSELFDRLKNQHANDDDWARIEAAVFAMDGESRMVAGQIHREDGMVIAYSVEPLPDGGTLVTFSDITDRTRAEQALIERNEALVEADRLKTAFVSHVSYELRTPLTNIIGFAELLSSPRTGRLNAKQREYLSDVHGSAKTLQTIINDILDLATIDAGNFDLRLAPTTPRAIIEAAVAGLADRMDKARIALTVSIDPDAGDFVADTHRAAHVVYNLLANAVGFSEPGSRVSVAAERRGAFMVFEVTDEGCGIPEDRQKSIFERFESNHANGRRRGAGLGLAIVKSLVELHGGTVALTSEIDVGTTVEVHFPLIPPQHDSVDATRFRSDTMADAMGMAIDEPRPPLPGPLRAPVAPSRPAMNDGAACLTESDEDAAESGANAEEALPSWDEPAPADAMREASPAPSPQSAA